MNKILFSQAIWAVLFYSFFHFQINVRCVSQSELLVKLQKTAPGSLWNATFCPPVKLNIQNQFVRTFDSRPRSTRVRKSVFGDSRVIIGNGIVEVTISNPGGYVVGINFNGVDNLLEVLNQENNRGYWDLVWNIAGTQKTKGVFDRMEGTDFKVIVEKEEQVELSFTRTWNFSQEGSAVPLNVDKRFVLLQGSSGFYTYAIYDHLKEWPAVDIDNTRVAFKLRKDKFKFMANGDKRQRYMPVPDDREPPRGQVLAYPEAVRLIDPIEPEFRGEVDDKYQYSSETRDARVHGWISEDPPTGFWQISASDEFRSGGPLKQILNSHVGPTTLSVFHSAHYAGADMIIRIGANEPWKKLYGPIFLYVNSLSNRNNSLSLWEDAKNQLTKEINSWPYDFPASEDFPKSDQRGSLSGRLLISDSYVSGELMPGKGALVGLAPPGEAGSWQTECKGYQFWTSADEEGYFSIKNIRFGKYNLYASVPGFIGDFLYRRPISIASSSVLNGIDLGDLIYEPPRDGTTLWEIGVPDRTAAEFYIPDPYPNLTNKLYVNTTQKYRQYGLWKKYADLYPRQDVIYTVGVSDYSVDWFFAQVNRETENNAYQGTTWQIKFQLDDGFVNGTYVLRLALATVHASELQVRVNDEKEEPPLFSTGVIGKDNTIARHGIHGLYRLFSAEISGTRLVVGNNTIFLTQASSNISPFQGIMYDYIRLEGPPNLPSSSSHQPTFE